MRTPYEENKQHRAERCYEPDDTEQHGIVAADYRLYLGHITVMGARYSVWEVFDAPGTSCVNVSSASTLLP